MGSEFFASMGAAVIAAVLGTLILTVLGRQNRDMREYREAQETLREDQARLFAEFRGDQSRQHAENKAGLAGIGLRLDTVNGRVRHGESLAASQGATLQAHIELEQEVRRLTEARTDQLRHDVNELRTDLKGLLKGGPA